MKGKANKAAVVVGAYYRPPGQDSNTSELFCAELRDVSRSGALVLRSDFNFTDIDWEYRTADRNRSRKFPQHIEDNFLVQVLRELTRKGALLDLLFVNRVGLVGEVVIGDFFQFPMFG